MQQRNINIKNIEEGIIRSISWKQERKEDNELDYVDLENPYYDEVSNARYEDDIFSWFEEVFFAREIWADYMEQKEIYREAGKYWKDYFASLRISYRLSTSITDKDSYESS